MVVSYLTVWLLDLLTSYYLVRSGFATLEGNVAVRTFFLNPSTANFVFFVMNQAPYLFLFAFAFIPLVLHWIRKSGYARIIYSLVGVLLFLLTFERLNFGVCSNTANIIAIVQRTSVPASGNLYYELWGVVDFGWAVIVILYLWMNRISQKKISTVML